ncbi:MAG: hypothetical protein ABI151_00080 [Chitinophagaceae bacterium]
MKRYLYIVFVICCMQSSLFAQDGNKLTKLESYKIAFITRKLNFTSEEAQKFWPVYNKYVAEITATRKQKGDMDEISFEEKQVAVRKKYRTEFAKLLNEEKANQYFQAEKEFNNTLRKELQERIAEEKEKRKPD